MRARFVFAAFLLIATATACGPTYDVAGIGHQARPHGQLALIVGMAQREARQLGDRHVSEVLIARGTRAQMDQALRVGSQPGDHPGLVVWVYEIRGLLAREGKHHQNVSGRRAALNKVQTDRSEGPEWIGLPISLKARNGRSRRIVARWIVAASFATSLPYRPLTLPSPPCSGERVG